MKRIVYILISIICVVLICIFFYNRKKINSYDRKAINLVKDYVKENNIAINDSLFVELKDLENNQDYLDCNNGSGVLVIKNNDELEYKSFLKCSNYITKINDNTNNISLFGQEILILNNDEEYIEPGYNSQFNIVTESDNYDHVKYIKYYVYNNEERIEVLKRVIINTYDKTKNIDGSDNGEYPTITLKKGDEIEVLYNTKFIEPGYSAFDKNDGDLTNRVEITGKVSNKIGEYSLKYFIMNSKGNYAITQRKVNVVSNEVNLKTNISLSTEEINSTVNIILKIEGNGYNYTILPNEKISREKEISFPVTENKTYKFQVYDINDEFKEVSINVNNIGTKKIKTIFTDNYPVALTNMRKIPSNLLSEYFVSKGFTSTDGQTYKLIINGESISYDVTKGKLSYNGDFVFSEFYATEKSVLGSMSNTITILAGSGERSSGAVGGSRISNNANLNDNSLLISLKKDNDYNMSKHPKMISMATKLGMLLAGIEKGNSIIGYSEGAQAAAKTVSSNYVKYDIVVLVNGSAYYTSNNANLISNYEPFKDMEILLLEAKNNNNWNETIIKTINNFLNKGINSTNIKLFTSDNELIRTFTNKINVTIISSNTWSGHGSGYRIINESNILSYLSSK